MSFSRSKELVRKTDKPSFSSILYRSKCPTITVGVHTGEATTVEAVEGTVATKTATTVMAAAVVETADTVETVMAVEEALEDTGANQSKYLKA